MMNLIEANQTRRNQIDGDNIVQQARSDEDQEAGQKSEINGAKVKVAGNLLGLLNKSDDKTVAVPNLHVASVDHVFCLCDGFAVVATKHLLRSCEMPVNANGIRSIFQHYALLRRSAEEGLGACRRR
jgi:hypothetical protein